MKSLKRDQAKEDVASKSRFAGKLAELRQLRDDGVLSEELIQVAQAMVLCGLPYNPTKETRIIRKARLGDGSTVTVVFIDPAIQYCYAAYLTLGS